MIFPAAVFVFLLLEAGLAQEQHCPTGWTYYESSCYLVVHDRDTWFEADVICQALHGHLVTIESGAENNFVANMLQKEAVTEAWIGLFDVAVENQFVWVTSLEQPEYTNWWNGQPDNSHEEDCVEMRKEWRGVVSDTGMHWNDNNCHIATSFVCERELGHGGVIG